MAYRALYREARPQCFHDVVGQDAVVRTLRSQVAAGRVGHAYLFSGPRGVGKTTVARIFARSINCQAPRDGEMCGVCPVCQALSAENNMDIIEIDAASNNGVDNIRDLRDNVGYLPAHGKYRVYIIDEVHMLSSSAFNALLKTLEEPPAHVVFILATTEVRKLPETVISRCQRYEFHRLGIGQMVDQMRKLAQERGIQAEEKGLMVIARQAQGGMRDALSMLDQCLSLGGGTLTVEDVYATLGTTDARYFYGLIQAMLRGDTTGAIARLREMVDAGVDVPTLAAELLRTMGELFVVMHTQDPAGGLDMDAASIQQLSALAQEATDAGVIRMLGILSTLESDLRYAGQPVILLEVALARCCQLEETQSVEALLERVQQLELRMRQLEERGPAAPSCREAPRGAMPEPEDDIPEEGAPPWEAPPPEEPPEDTPPWEEAPLPPPAEPEPAPRHEPSPASPAPTPQRLDPSALRSAVSAVLGEEKKQKPTVPVGAYASAQELWEAAISSMQEKGMDLQVTQMRRGRPSSLQDGRLTVCFLPKEKMAMRSLTRKKAAVAACLTELMGQPVAVEFTEEVFSQEEKSFVEESIQKLPADLVIIEQDDMD